MNELIKKEDIFIMNKDGVVELEPEFIELIREIEVQKKSLDKACKTYKKALLEGMEEYGLKKVESDDLLVTYIEPTERVVLDQDKLWKEHQDIAFECQKFSDVKASVRITVR